MEIINYPTKYKSLRFQISIPLVNGKRGRRYRRKSKLVRTRALGKRRYKSLKSLEGISLYFVGKMKVIEIKVDKEIKTNRNGEVTTFVAIDSARGSLVDPAKDLVF